MALTNKRIKLGSSFAGSSGAGEMPQVSLSPPPLLPRYNKVDDDAESEDEGPPVLDRAIPMESSTKSAFSRVPPRCNPRPSTSVSDFQPNAPASPTLYNLLKAFHEKRQQQEARIEQQRALPVLTPKPAAAPSPAPIRVVPPSRPLPPPPPTIPNPYNNIPLVFHPSQLLFFRTNQKQTPKPVPILPRPDPQTAPPPQPSVSIEINLMNNSALEQILGNVKKSPFVPNNLTPANVGCGILPKMAPAPVQQSTPLQSSGPHKSAFAPPPKLQPQNRVLPRKQMDRLTSPPILAPAAPVAPATPRTSVLAAALAPTPKSFVPRTSVVKIEPTSELSPSSLSQIRLRHLISSPPPSLSPIASTSRMPVIETVGKPRNIVLRHRPMTPPPPLIRTGLLQRQQNNKNIELEEFPPTLEKEGNSIDDQEFESEDFDEEPPQLEMAVRSGIRVSGRPNRNTSSSTTQQRHLQATAAAAPVMERRQSPTPAASPPPPLLFSQEASMPENADNDDDLKMPPMIKSEVDVDENTSKHSCDQQMSNIIKSEPVQSNENHPTAEQSSSGVSSSGSVSPPPFTPINGEHSRRARSAQKRAGSCLVAGQRRKRGSRVIPEESPDLDDNVVIPTKRARRTGNSSIAAKAYGPWIPTDAPKVYNIRFEGRCNPRPTACYTSISHLSQEVTFKSLDCVSVRGDSEQKYIGRLSRFFRHPDTGSMMAQVYWYYRPDECIEDNRAHGSGPPSLVKTIYNNWKRLYKVDDRELFASSHNDIISCEAIEDVSYVLKESEYDRYCAETKFDNLNGIQKMGVREFISRADDSYERRRLIPHDDTPNDAVYFCRFFYDHLNKKVIRKQMKPFITRNRTHRLRLGRRRRDACLRNMLVVTPDPDLDVSSTSENGSGSSSARTSISKASMEL